MSELNFKDYAGCYIGCKCFNTWFPEGDKPRNYNWVLAGFRVDNEKHYLLENDSHFTWTDSIKPILRKVEDITDEECLMVHKISPFWAEGTSEKYIRDRLYLISQRIMHLHLTPQVFHYLLQQWFDLFGLVDAGLALDSKTIK
jgi:hypothetical protein